MEMKYDNFYKKELPYKMTLEELFERATKDGFENPWYREEDVLAYIRHRGIDNVVFYMPARMMGQSGKAKCQIVNDESPFYNPLIEPDLTGRWYNPFKIKFTPTEFQGGIDTWYFSDFVSAIQDGEIEIWEEE